MENCYFHLDGLLIAVSHFPCKLVVDQEIRPLVKVHLPVKTPVKRLQERCLTESVVA